MQTDGHVVARQRQCRGVAEHRFWTYEVDDDLQMTVAKHAMSDLRSNTLQKRIGLWQRNEQIVSELLAGRRTKDLAAKYNISETMVSTVARRAGLPPHSELKRAIKNGRRF